MTSPFGRKPAHARSGRTRSTAAPSAAAEGRRSQASRPKTQQSRPQASKSPASRSQQSKSQQSKSQASRTKSPASRSPASKSPASRAKTSRSQPSRSQGARRATRAQLDTTKPLHTQATAASTTGATQAATARSAPATAPREAPGRHLEVVRRPARRRLNGPQRARVLVGGGALLSVGIAFALVFLHVFMAQRQFQLDRLSSQVATAQTNYSQLRLQVAQLEAPQQIIATAEGKLGMRQPGNVTYLTPSSPLPPAPSTPSSAAGGTTAGGSTSGATIAPAGDADWPQVKSTMAGSP